MNRQNFDEENVSNYPLTIARLAELQEDVQVPLKVLAGMQPYDSCIVSGCRESGDSGYVLVDTGAGYEVLEVKSGESGSTHLKPTTSNVEAENSDGEKVVVRYLRWLEWSTAGDYEYAALPRLWAKKAAQDGDWVGCSNGTNWNAGTTGVSLRVQYEGGRVHLYGELTWQPIVVVSKALIDLGYVKDVTVGSTLRATARTSATENYAISAEVAKMSVLQRLRNQLTLPSGYYTSGAMTLIPILYNGSPSSAVIDGEGNLLLSQSAEVGDVLKINCWLDV